MNVTYFCNFVATLFLFYFVTKSRAFIDRQWGPSNIRGYLYYVDFGPCNYTDLRLEVVFDYDVIAVPYGSHVQVECFGFTKDKDPSQKADWHETKIEILKPYTQILFDVKPELDLDYYLCRGRFSSKNASIHEPWSDFEFINRTDLVSSINPKPSLLVCQALKNPRENYAGAALIRVVDIDSANGPNETSIAEFDMHCTYLEYNGQGVSATAWALYNYDSSSPIGATPLCIDWIANWGYRVDDSYPNCVLKLDTLGTVYDGKEKYGERLLNCFDATVTHILCYAPRNLLLASLVSKTGYRLIKYDLASNIQQIMVNSDINENGKKQNSNNCARSLSHSWLTFDWRPYWTNNENSSANVVFMSENELWSYNIATDECQQISTLENLGINETGNITSEISQFDMDWSYFYWLNSTTYNIHAFSWVTKKTSVLDKYRIYDGETSEIMHNLKSPVYDTFDNVTSFVTYSPSMKPYPFLFECLIPSIDMDAKMSTDTTASIVLSKIWNASALCSRMSRPAPQLQLDCYSESDNGKRCHIAENVTKTRSDHFATELLDLVMGRKYVITVHASILGNAKLRRTITQSFTAEFPSSKNWWHYLLIAIAIIVIVASTLVTLYFGWYRQRKAVDEFLRRERIDASQLTLVTILGEGEFGEVWLANYSKKGIHNSNFEVALKMRKSNAINYQSTLMSADCFFQEAVALNFLRHPNIILSYGICTNYQQLPPILVLEYMDGGNCLDYIPNERAHLTNSDLVHICRDILRACCHLTNMRVVHKDIGARNVLIRKHPHSGKPDMAKLTDFGLARDVGKKETGLTSNVNKDTMFHLRSTAPEGFKGKFLFQSDVWSFGIFVWELYSLIDQDNPVPYAQISPLTSLSLKDYLQSGGILAKPHCAPSDVYLLMRQCWAYDPSERPVFRQLDSAWRLLASNLDQQALIKINQVSDAEQEELEGKNLCCENPEYITGTTEDQSKVIGKSQQKTSYCIDKEPIGLGYVPWDGLPSKTETKKCDNATSLLFNTFDYQAPVVD